MLPGRDLMHSPMGLMYSYTICSVLSVLVCMYLHTLSYAHSHTVPINKYFYNFAEEVAWCYLTLKGPMEYLTCVYSTLHVYIVPYMCI